jgi:hypothetical protein
MSIGQPRGRGDILQFWPEARRRKRRSWAALALLWVAAVLGGTAYGGGWLDGMRVPSLAGTAAVASTPGQETIRASFGFCHSGGGTNCVVDGDTIWLGGEKIRVADIDAPETHEPRCAAERKLGDQATGGCASCSTTPPSASSRSTATRTNTAGNCASCWSMARASASGWSMKAWRGGTLAGADLGAERAVVLIKAMIIHSV